MSGFVYTPGHGPAAWQRYIQHVNRARDGYLAVVERAHREYLTGPWPDRDSYQSVERSAWVTYYAAGRQAWRIYEQEMIAPPPPPPPAEVATPIYTGTADDFDGARPYTDQPTFTERPERMP